MSMQSQSLGNLNQSILPQLSVAGDSGSGTTAQSLGNPVELFTPKQTATAGSIVIRRMARPWPTRSSGRLRSGGGRQQFRAESCRWMFTAQAKPPRVECGAGHQKAVDDGANVSELEPRQLRRQFGAGQRGQAGAVRQHRDVWRGGQHAGQHADLSGGDSRSL